MNKIVLVTGVSLLVALAAPVFSQQTGNPAVTAPDSPKPRDAPAPTDKLNAVDQLFVRQAAIGGMAEVDLGKLAESRAQNDGVKRFARQMVEDHGKSNDRLTRIGRDNGALLPKSADRDPDVKAVRDQLDKLRGAQFDAAYIAAQIGDHQKTAHLLEHVIGSGQDAKVKAYAMETLPTVLRHLEMAKDIQASLSGATRN